MLMKADSRVRPSSDLTPIRSGPLGVVPSPVDLEATLPLGKRVLPSPEVLPMKCLRCQGPVERGTAPVRVERNGYKLGWESVPAWICRRCDLSYFEPSEVKTIQRAVLAMRNLPRA